MGRFRARRFSRNLMSTTTASESNSCLREEGRNHAAAVNITKSISYSHLWRRGALDVAGELNSFLRAHRILSVDRHFVQDGANSIWAICVSHIGDAIRPLAAGAKRPKVNYREGGLFSA